MKKYLILIFLFSLLTSFCLAIFENHPISMQGALELALGGNPQIKMAKLDVDSSLNSIKIASKLQNPSIHTFQNIGSTGQGNPQQVGADYTVEILKRNKRKKEAYSKMLSVSDNQKFQEQILIFEVKKAYIDLLLKKTNLKIIEEQKELTKELLDTTIKEAKKKNIAQTDVVQAKIAYNRSIMYTNIAKSEVVSSQNHFNSVLNARDTNYDTKESTLDDNYSKLLAISPKDNSITLEKVKAYALSNRFDLLSAKQEVETAQLNLKVVKSQLIPDVELSGGYAYQPKGSSDTGHFQQGAYAQASIVNIPLVYHYQPEIKNAKNEIEKAKLKYQDLETDIIRNATDAWEKYEISRNNLNFYNDELLVNSKELLEASIKGLNKKEIDITTFLVSKKFYLELILGYYDTLAQYYISYAELLKEMNFQDSADL